SGNSWKAMFAPRTNTAQITAMSGIATRTTAAIMRPVMIALLAPRQLRLADRSRAGTSVSAATVMLGPLRLLHRPLDDRGGDEVDDDGDDEERHRERDERRLVERIGLAPLVGDDRGHRVSGRERVERDLSQC